MSDEYERFLDEIAFGLSDEDVEDLYAEYQEKERMRAEANYDGPREADYNSANKAEIAERLARYYRMK